MSLNDAFPVGGSANTRLTFGGIKAAALAAAIPAADPSNRRRVKAGELELSGWSMGLLAGSVGVWEADCTTRRGRTKRARAGLSIRFEIFLEFFLFFSLG